MNEFFLSLWWSLPKLRNGNKKWDPPQIWQSHYLKRGNLISLKKGVQSHSHSLFRGTHHIYFLLFYNLYPFLSHNSITFFYLKIGFYFGCPFLFPFCSWKPATPKISILICTVEQATQKIEVSFWKCLYQIIYMWYVFD